MKKYFKYKKGQLELPVFFPDATRAVLKTLDSTDIKNTKTSGILVNTYHLWQGLGRQALKKFGGISSFMNFDGPIISDSGGFQVMSIIKKGIVKGKVKDEGVVLHPGKNKRLVFSPEDSIKFQMDMGTDMVVVLDDFTEPNADYKSAKETVERTLIWAKRSKKEFERIRDEKNIPDDKRPYLLGVAQGGEFADLRKYCVQELVKIGFDGLGWGGWPIDSKGDLDVKSAQIIVGNVPEDYLLYGLGVGMPEDIVKSVSIGFNIFDCVLPTRDGRHGRLYVYNVNNVSDIDVTKENFYSFYDAKKAAYLSDTSKVTNYCDCELCVNYSKAYLAHLFKIGDTTAMRLSSIHNLRFYSLLMEKLRMSK